MTYSQTTVPIKRHNRTSDRERIRRDQRAKAERLSQQVATNSPEALPKQ